VRQRAAAVANVGLREAASRDSPLTRHTMPAKLAALLSWPPAADIQKSSHAVMHATAFVSRPWLGTSRKMDNPAIDAGFGLVLIGTPFVARLRAHDTGD
jgi:hypothetical protein